ncbi:pyrroline-5-carboxylate reductase, partial [Klebsiella oxytoca]
MRLGFIGAGNMAQAMIGGVLKSGLLKKEEIIASAK